MVFRISPSRRLLLYCWIGAIFLAAGCAPPTTVSAQVVPQPTCMSPASGVNPYSSPPKSGAVTLYQSYVSHTLTYSAVRQAALSQLGKSIAQWSAYTDIVVGGRMVRIVVTYLDPVLIQYIVLNHVLLNPNPDLNGFNTMQANILRKLGNRNETLFIITLTTQVYTTQASNNSALAVHLPIWKLLLINATGTQVKPSHVDAVLNETIDITHKPVSGMVGYPLAVINQGQCTWVMDSWTNDLTLHLDSVTLGDKPSGPQFWNIHYSNMGLQLNNYPLPTLDPNYDMSHVSWATAPPSPNWNPALQQYDGTNWKAYWDDMGRYFWYLLSQP